MKKSRSVIYRDKNIQESYIYKVNEIYTLYIETEIRKTKSK